MGRLASACRPAVPQSDWGEVRTVATGGTGSSTDWPGIYAGDAEGLATGDPLEVSDGLCKGRVLIL